jgi:hypothetical protein
VREVFVYFSVETVTLEDSQIAACMHPIGQIITATLRYRRILLNAYQHERPGQHSIGSKEQRTSTRGQVEYAMDIESVLLEKSSK